MRRRGARCGKGPCIFILDGDGVTSLSLQGGPVLYLNKQEEANSATALGCGVGQP